MDYNKTVLEIKNLVDVCSSKEISSRLNIKISDFYNICKRENIPYKKMKGVRLFCPDKKPRVRRKKEEIEKIKVGGEIKKRRDEFKELNTQIENLIPTTTQNNSHFEDFKKQLYSYIDE